MTKIVAVVTLSVYSEMSMLQKVQAMYYTTRIFGVYFPILAKNRAVLFGVQSRPYKVKNHLVHFILNVKLINAISKLQK
ncbi:unnamed protein product [Heterobilharzia americana]|nr:unnamed protein product [Heterobilharzia americana]